MLLPFDLACDLFIRLIFLGCLRDAINSTSKHIIEEIKGSIMNKQGDIAKNMFDAPDAS
jgi:hypothetical protein